MMTSLYNKIYTDEINTVIVSDKYDNFVDNALCIGLLKCINRDIDFEIKNKKDLTEEDKKDPSKLLINLGGEDYDSNSTMFDLIEGTDIRMNAFLKLFKDLSVDFLGIEELANVAFCILKDVVMPEERKNALSIIDILDSYIPVWNETDRDLDPRLITASELARCSLERFIFRINADDQGIDIVESIKSEAYEKGKEYLVLDKNYDCYSILEADTIFPVRFVVYPAPDVADKYATDILVHGKNYRKKFYSNTIEDAIAYGIKLTSN